MNYNYLLKQIKKANRKSIKIFEYLKQQETKNYNQKLQVTINRLCDINEILTNLEITLEIELGVDKESKECKDEQL